MAFHTITAKYAGICGRCGQPFPAGEQIRYGGRRRTYHFAAACPSGSAEGDRADRDGAKVAAGEDAHLDDDSAEAVAMRSGYTFGGWINDR